MLLLNYINKLILPELSYFINVKVGDLVQINYKNFDNSIEEIEGFIILCKNKNLCKELVIKRKVGLFGLRQIFFFTTQRIINIKKLGTVKVNRARLFFTRGLSNKKTRQKFAKKSFCI